jgi:heat shock protein HslJ
MKHILSLVTLSLSLLHCASEPLKPSLDDSRWTMVEYKDSSGTAAIVTYPSGKSGDGYWLAFEQDTLYGSDNCNHFSGTYTVDNASFKTSNILSTLIGCPEVLDMIPALTMVERYKYDGTSLRLYSNHRHLAEMIFEKVKP